MAKLIISLDGVTVREIVLDRGHISLGRRPYNHIVLDNLAISGDHAVFQYVAAVADEYLVCVAHDSAPFEKTMTYQFITRTAGL